MNYKHKSSCVSITCTRKQEVVMCRLQVYDGPKVEDRIWDHRSGVGTNETAAARYNLSTASNEYPP